MSSRPFPRVALVAAMGEGRVIGRGNRLPWHLPADLRHFRQLTLDKTIVMGRKTWESLPGPLPRRRHVVVTRDSAYEAPGCEIATSVEAALRLAGNEDEILVIGGAELYRVTLPYAQRLYLTLIHADFDGDTWFPDWDPADWTETFRDEHAADAQNPYGFAFVVLDRRGPASARPRF